MSWWEGRAWGVGRIYASASEEHHDVARVLMTDKFVTSAYSS